MTHDNDQRSKIDGIREKIRREFPAAVFSGRITRVDGRSDEELDEEQAIFEALSGRKWSDIPGTFLERNPDAFVLLVDDAFVAFLPAWLSFSLSNDTVREFLIYTFAPHTQTLAKWTDHMRSRLSALTAAQRTVLLDVLKLLSETESSGFVKEHAEKAVDYVSRFIEENSRRPVQE